MDERPEISFNDEHSLHVTYDRMRQFHTYVQNFAIFVEPSVAGSQSMHRIRTNISTFRNQILSKYDITHIVTKKDLEHVSKTGTIGAILSIEGCDCLQNPTFDVKELYDSGVRMLSLTWNHSNWAADGCFGSDHGGLSQIGKQFVNICNELGMILDVSHLSDQSFSQLTEMSIKPFVATHSNCRSICEHPRNLTNQQLQTIINRNGIVGLNLVPAFVSTNNPDIASFLHHYEHVCELGGAKHVALGTDFDGIDQTIIGIEHNEKLYDLASLMSRRYGDQRTHDFLYQNWFHFLLNNLP